METDANWLISAGLVTSSIIAIAANGFLLLIFCRRRGLRTVPNRFVINLLITNLLSSLLLIPLLVVDQSHLSPLSMSNSSTNEDLEISNLLIVENATDLEIIETETLVTWTNESFVSTPTPNRTIILCYASQMSTSFVSTLSILSILLIGINQYFGVIHSLRYHFYINKCRSTISILSTWLVALVFAILSSSTESDSFLWRSCSDRPPNSRTVLVVLNSVYAVTYCIAVILVPFVAVCVIYVCIYTAAHKNSERMRKSTSTNLETCEAKAPLPKVRSAPNFMRIDDLTTTKVTRTSSERATNNFITSIKHKISNASVFKYREETRAAKISVLVIFLVLFCYLPYGVTLVLNSGLIGIETSAIFNFNTLLLLALSNVISPFLFGYRNKRVKREIGKLFGLVPPKHPDLSVLNRRRSTNDDHMTTTKEPFLGQSSYNVPEVIVTCKVETERKSILKRVCQSSNWTSYKKCNFITVPDSCISGEARGSFSSASTQISNEDC